jgi:uncharacterized protein (DUF302 family)
MTTTRKRLGTAARKVARRAGKAVMKAEQKVEKKIRQQKRRRALKHAGRMTLLAGTAALAATAVEEAGKIVRKRMEARRPSKPLGFEVRLPVDMELAVARVTDALRSEGFGILTRIDVRATLKEKLGAEFRPYLILGACNPELAHRALSADAETGLVLPCNVTVEEMPEGGTLVRIADPAAMLQLGALGKNELLRLVAKEAESRLRRAGDQLSRSPTPAAG